MKTQAAITILLLLASTLFVQAQSTQSIPNSVSTTTRTDLDICVEQKTNKYVSDMKIASFEVLMNTEQLQKKAQFTAECSAESQKAAQQKAIAAQQAAAVAAANSTSNNTSGSSGAASTAAAGTAGLLLARQMVQALPDSKTATTPQAQPSSGSAPGGSVPAGGSASAAAPAAAAAPVGGNSVASADTTVATPAVSAESGSASAEGAASSASMFQANDPFKAGPQSSYLQPDNPASLNLTSMSPSELAGAKEALGGEVQAVAQTSPQLADTSQLLLKNADGGGATAPATDITTTAKQRDAELTTASKTLQNMSFMLTGTLPPFSKTAAAVQALSAKIDSYISTAKGACTTLAEKTEFLCMEGTSPGAIAARQVMNVAGPVLAVVNSAQKACSSTAKVSKMVGTGLTIAKGVCVASKLACDGACTIATSSFATIMQMASAEMKVALDGDAAVATSYCSANTITDPSCVPRNQTRMQQVMATLLKVQTSLKAEQIPATPGTTPNIALRCQSHMKDILLFAVNLAGLMQSKKSAESCEKTLAASGNTGVTPAQYCENTANAATQFCICQKNNTATGCPGAIANSLNPNSTDPAGTNIKSTSGNSAFASGFKPTAVNSGLNKNAMGGLGSSGSGASGVSADGAANTGANTSSDFNGGSQGLAGTNAPGGGSGDEKSASGKGSSDKKWNFGSLGEFGSSLGGLFGGKSGSDKSGNGALNQKQMDAIKRQIASEQRSAQVSSATGKSNWEKVQQRYLMNSSSFLNGR